MSGKRPVDTKPASQTQSQVIAWLAEVVDDIGGQTRTGQQRMAEQVTEAFETGTHLLVQAGTGTGKSLAYLVPAVEHALGSDAPVVIATATLALQSQIINRDLPRMLASLEPTLPRAVDVALLKGRANYVCKHKLHGAAMAPRTMDYLIPQMSQANPYRNWAKLCGCEVG